MGLTPDRRPGEANEEGTVYENLAVGNDPPTVGGVRLVNGAFRMRDAIGVFNPRTNLPAFQSSSSRIAVNTTTTSTTFVDLLSVTLTTQASFLLIFFTCGVSNTAGTGQTFFRVLVNGVAVAGAGASQVSANRPVSCAISHRIAVNAGSNIVKVQWRVANATGQIRPVAAPDAEHANVIVMEVAA